MGNDDTGYDQAGYNVELTGDRSQNGAQALPGYVPDVREDPSWPGTEGSKNLRLQPEAVHTVQKWLTSRAADVQHLPQWLSQQTAVSFGPEAWIEAKNLRDASTLVSQAVTEFIGKTVANMNQAAGSIQTARQTYLDSDHATDNLVQNVNSRLGDGGGGAGGGDSSSAGGIKQV